MRVLLGTTVVGYRGNRNRPVIQNLGPGTVYLDSTPDVSATSGIKIAVGGDYDYSVPPGDFYIIATEANTDVRLMGNGPVIA